MRRPKASSTTKTKASTSSAASPPKGPTRRKRVKAPAAPKETMYFEEKRSLEDLWQAAFPVGTEWDNMDKLRDINWNFSNLESAFEEGGELYGKKVYLFGCTEPQLLEVNGEHKVTLIPIVVVLVKEIGELEAYVAWGQTHVGARSWTLLPTSPYQRRDPYFHTKQENLSTPSKFSKGVVSPIPPSDKIGIKSVQRETEEIIPMKAMKMTWIPYIPLEDRDKEVVRLKTQIYTMGCTQRRSALKHLKIERVKQYDYCLPYFQPLKADEDEDDTVVNIMYPLEPPIVCDFDWELDELEVFTDDLIKEEALPEDQKDAFKEYVKEQVRERKRTQRQAKEARKKAIEDMNPETRAAFENMRFYKFYPVQTPDTPDISGVKVAYINRYYGKAHVLV